MNFNGKTALITGASVGIGRAVAHLMAHNGAKVILLDINMDKLNSVKEELKEYAENVLIYQCDVSDEISVNETVKDATDKFGTVDILVNNAALWRDFNDFMDVTTDEWKKYIDINVMGVVYLTRSVLPGMLDKNYGRIINVASVAGVYGNKRMVHYSATKGAVISMTKGLAKEVADKGITVNSISPGTVSPSQDPDMNAHVPSNLSYMGRTGTDMENANLICYLAGDEAAYISGENIVIDGCRKIL